MNRCICFLLVCLFVSPSIAQEIRTAWPMINGDAAHTSYASIDIDFPLMMAPLIQFDYSVEDGTVITADKIFLSESSDTNFVHALDRNTGDWIWSFPVPNSGGSISFTPAAAHGIVLAGGQGAAGLYGLNEETGEVMWLMPVGGLYTRAPVIFDSLVYVATFDGLICADLFTGDTIWTHGDFVPQYSPAVDSSNVYFNHDGVIYAKDRLTGAETWSNTDVASGHFMAYTVDENHLYVGYEGDLTALDVVTGEVVWQVELDTNEISGYYPGTFALKDNFLVAKTIVDGLPLNHYRVINASTGEVLARFDGAEFHWGAPTIINDYLVDCAYGNIFFLDLMTGDTVYSLMNLPFGHYPSQVIAADDKIYIASQGPNIIVLQTMASGLTPIHPATEVSLFPNPSSDFVEIGITLTTSALLDLQILTIDGSVVIQQHLGNLAAGEYSFPISLKKMAAGMYIVRVSGPEGMTVKKLIVD